MRLANRRPGSSTAFVDASTGETLLQVVTDKNGDLFIGFRLYDANGCLVAASQGLQPLRRGLAFAIRSSCGDILLDVPADLDDHVSYQLRNQTGQLVTLSDGAHTRIFSLLRMEGTAGQPRPTAWRRS